ncbi:hypothetical protein [Amycolatopsis sp. cmx-11-32]|uniref:hypothetical protein n=1 Tax=Amycolatopsis sp. cmx-11-32 TaxID=2785796 RepID=UPI0039E2B98D
MLKKVMIGAFVLGAAQLAVIAPATATTDPSWYLGPSELGSGEQIYAETKAAAGGCFPGGPVTSPGLAAPIQWTVGGNFGTHGGFGNVVKTPGEYVATLTCSDGRKSTRMFTVTGVPPKSTAARAKGPQVAVKPVGTPRPGGDAFGLRPMAWDW